MTPIRNLSRRECSHLPRFPTRLAPFQWLQFVPFHRSIISHAVNIWILASRLFGREIHIRILDNYGSDIWIEEFDATGKRKISYKYNNKTLRRWIRGPNGVSGGDVRWDPG